jgi:sugar phosphate isomerase/epimerase
MQTEGLSINLATVRPELEAQIARAGRDKRILGYHICDWLVPTRDLLLDRGMPGDGVIDLPRIRGWIEQAGYKGRTEIEVFSSGNWWTRPGDEVLKTCIERYNDTFSHGTGKAAETR